MVLKHKEKASLVYPKRLSLYNFIKGLFFVKKIFLKLVKYKQNIDLVLKNIILVARKPLYYNEDIKR